MSSIQKVYLSGLGAVGSSYASKLYEMDPGCLKVIIDGNRIERYTREGVKINDKTYMFDYIEPAADNDPADLIIIAVKQHHLEQSIKDISKFVGKDTIILSLLNGISSEEIIGRKFGMDKLLYSFCVGIDAVREGTNTQFTKIGKIVFGDKINKSYSPKVAAVKELFDKAGIPYNIPEDMIRELWWKFMMNVGLNQTSAILKASYGVFQSVPEAKELMIMGSREVINLANKVGINLTENDIDAYLKIISTLTPEGKTSMHQDIEAGRKTEVEIFAGTVIDLGRKYNIATPVNDMFFKMIRALEQM
jgi:2-dehydropantoate 2-reductase